MDIDKLTTLLSTKPINKAASDNQRAWADIIEETACAVAMSEFPDQFKKARSVRSPEDFALSGTPEIYVDIKTRQLGTDFNMPNLISVDRLDKILSDSNLELYYWFVDYEIVNGECVIRHNEIRTVWSLSWDALAIQNLGKGQLQICKWEHVPVHVTDKQAWHKHLREARRCFYLKQVKKFQRMADALI